MSVPLPSVLEAVLALLLLFGGGEALVRGASRLASRLGVSSLVIGLTVVAFGTSAPELIVSLGAALTGADDISVGNVVGSNIANIALIVGIAATIKPIVSHARVFRVHAPIMVFVSLALVAILASGTVTRLEGIALLAGLAGYLWFTFSHARSEVPGVQAELATVAPSANRGLMTSGALVLGGLALLIWGGDLLIDASVTLAESLGVSQAVIGLTIVAVGTSVPELVTSVVAAVRGQGDIALGNVVGSNIFNVLGIVGLTATVRPLQSVNIAAPELGAMVLFATILIPLLWTRGQLGRIEGLLLVGAYIGFVWFVVLR